VTVEGEEEYLVEEILDSRLRRNKLEFLVKWGGYTNEHNLWDRRTIVGMRAHAIAAFYRKYPQAPRRIARMQFNGLNFDLIKLYSTKHFMISRLEVEV